MSSVEKTNEVILLWPEGAPGSEELTQVEEEMVLPPSLKVVRNVTQPSLTVYPADPGKATGTAVIVCPGGGWHFLSIDKEGTDVACWLAARGVTSFVLRYRLLRTGDNLVEEFNHNLGDFPRFYEMLQPLLPLAQLDGQQAMHLVRQRAAEWGIAPDRVGMLGFSAGADFTVNATLNNSPEYRPDFAAAIYPAGFNDVELPEEAPPLFLLCANDDDMAVAASTRLYSAWKEAGAPVELHIYAQGGHGFGMEPQGLPSDAWIERFWDWLHAQGLLERLA